MLTLDDATIDREARWLKESGNTFAANLLEALWRDIRQRERHGRAGEPGWTYGLDIDSERYSVIRMVAERSG